MRNKVRNESEKSKDEAKTLSLLDTMGRDDVDRNEEHAKERKSWVEKQGVQF